MEYLHYELTTDYPGLMNRLRSVNNNAEGAYQAAYDWCYNFEVPANTKNAAVSRGNLARDTYWPYYSGFNDIEKDDISISGATVPHQMKKGTSFDVRGSITSKYILTSVTVGVYDCDDVMQIGQTVEPNSTNYDLRRIDTSLKFGSLESGGYRYRVVARTGRSVTTLVDSAFMVLSNGRTVVKEQYIESMKNNGYGLNKAETTMPLGANVVLGAKSSSNYMKYVFSYQSNGYYKIKNAALGPVSHGSNRSEISIRKQCGQQASGGTRWQCRLPDGKGS